jgi:redox-regulated HSP33 family molecular chaperone
MKGICILRCAAVTAGMSSGVTRAAATLSASSPPASAASSSSASVHSTLHSLRTRDITLRIPSKDRLLRISFCSTRYLLAETIRRHSLLRLTGANIPFLQLLGTQLTFTNLLASALEGEERVETRFTTEEATILTEALALGECRCYLRPEFNAQLEEQRRPTFPLRVNRILYRQQTPFSSLVHADLAELLQPPTSTANHAQDGEVADHAVPFSLCTPTTGSRVPLDAWTEFFSHNSTLHAYNYLRRSDGCVPAVWMHTALDPSVLRTDGLLNIDGTPVDADLTNAGVHLSGSKESEKAEEAEAQAFQRTLRHAISHSFGVIVTPLAAGDAVDRQVGQLNRVLAEAAALLYASPQQQQQQLTSHAEAAFSPLRPLLEQCATKHTTCQYVLSLLSGDHDGAHASTVAARQYSEDPAQVAAVVNPIRRTLGVHDLFIPLAATEAVRTGLDFFCRCSKKNVVTSLVAAPPSVLASLKENQGTVNCSFCGKHHTLHAEDWAELERSRVTTPPAASLA